MKAVILAGGLGTRIAEESHLRPKPMIKIGEMPILWHIMKIYHAHGVNDFVICLGYRGYIIKEFMANYALHSAVSVSFDMQSGDVQMTGPGTEPWKVTLVETGLNSQTGGRLARIKPWVEDEEAFYLTYGDGLADVDIGKSLAFHKAHGKLATVTTVSPPGRFGAVETDGDAVMRFSEKPSHAGAEINGGFFVLSPKVIDYIDGDDTIWEREPLERLAADAQLCAFRHDGFWQPMDTIRERNLLEEYWASGNAPWQVW